MVSIKTIIELFDVCQIENVIACINLKPQKLIFVGFKNIMTKRRCSALKSFLSLKGLDDIEVEFEIVSRYDYNSIVDKLNFLIDNNEDCIFDLTGGKELVLTAMGAVSVERNVPMVQFDVRENKLNRIRNCDTLELTDKAIINLNECMTLNGCSVLHNEDGDFNWEFTDDFKDDVEVMWHICKLNCGLWSRQSKVFESFKKMGRIDSEFCVVVNIDHMKRCKQDVLLNKRIISELIKYGLICNYKLSDGILTFKFKNSQVYHCITKAGNILELYSYLLIKEIAEEDASYYDDIDLSVYLDWDGIVHNRKDLEKDTKNEVDILIIRDLVPIFVSCKNGDVDKDALYELSTVASKLGGKYSKKYMIASYLCRDDESYAYLIQRAKDMDIVIIDGVHEMNRDEFKTAIKNKIK